MCKILGASLQRDIVADILDRCHTREQPSRMLHMYHQPSCIRLRFGLSCMVPPVAAARLSAFSSTLATLPRCRAAAASSVTSLASLGVNQRPGPPPPAADSSSDESGAGKRPRTWNKTCNALKPKYGSAGKARQTLHSRNRTEKHTPSHLLKAWPADAGKTSCIPYDSYHAHAGVAVHACKDATVTHHEYHVALLLERAQECR